MLVTWVKTPTLTSASESQTFPMVNLWISVVVFFLWLLIYKFIWIMYNIDIEV